MKSEQPIINIITKTDIRFQGILVNVDKKNKTITLKDIRNFGTENRNMLEIIEPVNEIIPFINFNSLEIKELNVVNKLDEINNNVNNNSTFENNYKFEDFFDNISTSVIKSNLKNIKNYKTQIQDAKETFGNNQVNNHTRFRNNQNYSVNYNKRNNYNRNFNKNKNPSDFYYKKKQERSFYYIKKTNNTNN